MKRALVALVILAVATSASATNYYWANTSTGTAGGLYNNTANWDLAALPGVADNAYVQNGGSWRLPTGVQNITYGQLVFGATSNAYFDDMLNLTLNVGSAGGTGDFISHGAGAAANYRWQFTLNIYGNYLVTSQFYGAGWEYTAGHMSVINLYGTNKAFKDMDGSYLGYRVDRNIYGSYWDNGSSSQNNCSNTITVKNGGQIIRRAGANNSTNASIWEARRFIFEGGQSNLPALGDCVTFSFMPYNTDNGAPGSNRLVIAGGVQYPMDVRIGAGYRAGANLAVDKTFTYRFKNTDCSPAAQTVIGRDLLLCDQSGSFANDGTFLNFEENGTLGKVKVVVKRDMSLVGTYSFSGAKGTTLPTLNERLGFRGKNADIRIGQNLTIGAAASGYYGWWPVAGEKVDLGNATIRLGQNLRINRLDPVAKAFWNAGTSTLICDGNGTSKTQQIRTYGICDGIKLNNFIVRNPGGVVVLENSLTPQNNGTASSGDLGRHPYLQGGDLLLSGNLSVECGTFRTGDTNQPGCQIAFNGPNHTIYVDPSAIVQGTVGTVRTNGVFDNMILYPSAQLTLLSSITISSTDNFLMKSGSKLYLNGFTLTAYGQQYVSANIDAAGIPFTKFGSSGTIYGTLSVPEPATLLLLGSGLFGGLGWMRRRRLK